MDRGRSPRTDETTGIAFHYDRPNAEPPQTMLLALPAELPRRAGEWDDLVDALHETLDLARKRAVEPRHVDATAYARFLPATIVGGHLLPAHCRCSTSPFNNDGRSSRPTEVLVMNQLIAIENIEAVLAARATAPDDHHVEPARGPAARRRLRLRALRAEVRDAAVDADAGSGRSGEFRGDDAGSPVFAKVHVDTTRLDKLPAGRARRPSLRRRRCRSRRSVEQTSDRASAARPAACRSTCVLLLGRHWLKLLAAAGIGGYAPEYIADLPDRRAGSRSLAAAALLAPTRSRGSAVAASPAARWTARSSTLPPADAAPPRVRRDRRWPPATSRPSTRSPSRVRRRGSTRLFAQPPRPTTPGCRDRLEYQFAVLGADGGGEKVLWPTSTPTASSTGTASTSTPTPSALGDGRTPPPSRIQARDTQSFLPAPVSFDGMPHTAGGRSRTAGRTSATSGPTPPTSPSCC